MFFLFIIFVACPVFGVFLSLPFFFVICNYLNYCFLSSYCGVFFFWGIFPIYNLIDLQQMTLKVGGQNLYLNDCEHDSVKVCHVMLVRTTMKTRSWIWTHRPGLLQKICHQKKNGGSYLKASSHSGLPLLTVSSRVGRFSLFVKPALPVLPAILKNL